ncbi:DUF4935 domain-containing protein [Burkholderia cenocepacia]|uniref:PIN domain-containing protein n=1 Tax=Burkholderia cepacia complex TaxID=87882 RepID=UPI001B96019D|nr:MULTISPECIES: PIN domain-containing protein [Burkholderia cepacia complex]MBR8173753.1 DUF4935 domain-containing protein [Burkholderia cenocepacia]MCO8319002.1 DUF4935 domain-containing protein [Burkholderia multivorans]
MTVVFDTNAILSNEFDTFVSEPARQLIARHSNHGDLDIRWVIPDIVRGEREYQMRNHFRTVAGALEKAERLLGTDWGITREVVGQRIQARIAEEVAALRIQVVPCAIERVNWNDIMRRACFREPPFDPSKNEKGFRDAIICETFVQLAADLADGDTTMLVSGDHLVAEYINSCRIEKNRARVVENLEALNDEIQLRVTNIDEDTQALIERRAQRLFYDWDNPDDPKSLWSRQSLHDRIWAQFGERLRQAPDGTTHVLVGQELSNARLVSKDGARVHFESILLVKSAFRVFVPAPALTEDLPAGASLPASPLQGLPQFNPKGGLLGMLGAIPVGDWKQIDKAQPDSISIRWSATYTGRRTLTHASIDSITLSE